jgi:uncharacterized membrane protein
MGFEIQGLSIIGLGLTFYLVYVKNKMAVHKDYKPRCDINRYISCSKAIKSEYSQIFGFPNTILGLAYYFGVFILAFFRTDYVFYLTVPAVMFSLVLMYLSYVKMKNFCLVCTGSYILTIVILVVSYVIEFL